MTTANEPTATKAFRHPFLSFLNKKIVTPFGQRLKQSNHFRAATAFVIGLLFALGLAPYGLWLLNLLSVTAFLILIRGHSLKQMILISFWYGLGVYLHGVSWVFISIHIYGNTPIIAAIPLTIGFILYFTLLLIIQVWVFHKFQKTRAYLIAFPAVWALFEWVRSWLFTGCPWLLSGYSYIDTPLAGYGPIFGVYGISFFAVLTSTLLANTLQNKTHLTNQPLTQKSTFRIFLNRESKSLAIILAIWILGYGLTFQDWVTIHDDADNKIQVSIIQGNIPQDQKWVSENLEPTIKLYHDLTLEEINHSNWEPDVIIWPEAAIPTFYHDAMSYFDELDRLALSYNVSLITGILITKIDRDQLIYHNSIIALGNANGIYHKQKLVPFGEIYPFTDSLKSIIPFYGQLNSFTPGEQDQSLLVAKGHPFASYICYEVIYPDFARQQARQADFLLTISNDAWFGNSIAPWQHFEMARMRALENGRYMIRGTNTGITGIIDHKGQVVSIANQFEKLIHRGAVNKITGSTPFNKWGSTPLLLFLCALLLISYLTTRVK